LFQINEKNKLYSIIAVTLSLAITMINISIIAIALPKISNSLQFTKLSPQWIINAYILSMTSFGLISGKLSDLFKSKNIMIIGLFLFIISSFGCFYSSNYVVLIFFRAIQGAASVLFSTPALNLLSKMFNHNELGRAIGTATGVASIGLIVAPPFGGWIIELLDWRWIFLISLPLCVIAILSLLKIKEENISKENIKKSPTDYAGFAYISLFLFLMVFSIMESNSEQWNKLVLTFTFIISILALILFVYSEKGKKTPLINFKILKRKRFIAANIISFSGQTISISVIFWITYMQTGLLYTPAETAMLMLPLYSLISLFSFISGKWIDSKGPSLPLFFGVFATFTGCTITTLVLSYKDYWTLIPAIIGTGIGFSIILNSIRVIVINMTSQNELGVSLGLLGNLRQIFGCISLAIFSNIESYYQVSESNYFFDAIYLIMLINVIVSFISLILSGYLKLKSK
tara:strand:+ start:69 stop:1445 length:1377 start_codon:yes stop_codon:yes gene_type:complete